MKRVLVVLLILLVFPIFIKAECDYNKHTKYMEYASNITYETSYSMNNETFTLTFYNVIQGLHFKIGTKTYYPNDKDIVIIDELAEGKNLSIYVYGDEDCKSQVGNITINLPYYNAFYGSNICEGYEHLTLCSSKFTTVRASRELIEKTKANYDNVIVQDKNETGEAKPSVIFNIVDAFSEIFVKYVLPILIAVASTLVAIVVNKNRLSKVEHGI